MRLLIPRLQETFFTMLKQQVYQFLNNPVRFTKKIQEKIISRLYPDRYYLKKRYREKTGDPLDLKNPTTFNEKLQWLKLNYRKPILTKLADKYLVREYVEKKVSHDILVPLYNVYNHYKDIKFDDLPDQFALKATHGSGWNVICKDKGSLDWNKTQYLLERYFNTNMYYINREWGYKNIKPRFICEHLLISRDNKIPSDFKFFCFHGEPKLFQLDKERFTGHKRNFYDLNWNQLSLKVSHPHFESAVKKPDNFERMVEIARILSDNIPFVRVDLYNLKSKIYFGEMTFYPDGGYTKFQPAEWNHKLGEWISL